MSQYFFWKIKIMIHGLCFMFCSVVRTVLLEDPAFGFFSVSRSRSYKKLLDRTSSWSGQDRRRFWEEGRQPHRLLYWSVGLASVQSNVNEMYGLCYGTYVIVSFQRLVSISVTQALGSGCLRILRRCPGTPDLCLIGGWELSLEGRWTESRRRSFGPIMVRRTCLVMESSGGLVRNLATW